MSMIETLEELAALREKATQGRWPWARAADLSHDDENDIFINAAANAPLRAIAERMKALEAVAKAAQTAMRYGINGELRIEDFEALGDAVVRLMEMNQEPKHD